MIKVQKRNGQIIEFIPSRITHAIASAFKAQSAIPRETELGGEMMNSVQKVTDCVVSVLKERGPQRPFLTVEEIQDEVIRQLYENGHKAVAERYASYRRHHAGRRKLFELYSVIKRDGKVVAFKQEKITLAIAKALVAQNKSVYNDILIEKAQELSEKVIGEISTRWPEGKSIHIEEVQDLVERVIMAAGYHEVAKRYIIYREDRAKARRNSPQTHRECSLTGLEGLLVKNDKGVESPIDLDVVRFNFDICCKGLGGVSPQELLKEVAKYYVNGMTERQLWTAHIMAARACIERTPNYGFVAARLLLLLQYQEALGQAFSFEGIREQYPQYLTAYIEEAIGHECLTPSLKQFDLKLLGKAIVPERDLLFRYMGLLTLYDHYFVRWQERRVELPQIFWMRVAMGLALKEGQDKNRKAIEFYHLLSTFRFIPSAVTLLNAGTCHPQLSSSFSSTIDNDVQHIFKCIQDDAMIFKGNGGLGNDWTNVAGGIIPFLKVANDAGIAINQGVKRHEAMCAYLEVWHLDIEDFLQLRANSGDDCRRARDMHTAVWISDLFMKRVKNNADWTLFSPDEVSDLHHVYGKAFESLFEGYEQKAREGKIKNFKTINAVQLWRKMLGLLLETGYPWLTWKDPSNVRSPQDHAGVIHGSDGCADILLNTSKDETSVCGTGAVNLAVHVTEKGIDVDKLKETITTAVRILDNMIDINSYPTVESTHASGQHRPIGLGIMGFQDALYTLNISYASQSAVNFADESMELVSYYALLADAQLVRDRGAYPSYKGSKWDRGLLPVDTIVLLEQQRGGYLSMDTHQRMDWSPVRSAIKEHGLRNSLIMAIAPTQVIGHIAGVTSSIEPMHKNIFVKGHASGKFTLVNEYLVEELKVLGLWDQEMIDDLKYFDGSVQEITRIPPGVKAKYATAFEIDYEWIIEAASRRQKWIDMGQSLVLYQAKPNAQKISDMYMYAWEKGLKTTCHLRSVGSTRIEKSALDIHKQAKVADALKCKEKTG